jgi:hypothetical protein
MAAALMTGLAARAEDSNGVTGVLDFKNVPVSEVLRIYQKLSNVDLVIDSHVRQVDSKITLATTAPLTKDEVAKLIEKTLLCSPLKNYGYRRFIKKRAPARRDEGEYPLWIFD